MVTLVQNEDFYPHPIRRELKPIIDLFTEKNMGNITHRDKALNIREMRGWLAEYYNDYCQIFQLNCNQTGCGISDDCKAGQFCHDTEDGQFECGHKVSQIYLDNGQKYFGQINKGEIQYNTNQAPCQLLVTGEIPNGHGVSYYHEDPLAIQYEGNLSALRLEISQTSQPTQETGELANKQGQGSSST